MSVWQRSSYSTYNGNCVEVAPAWRKSSYSFSNCAEVAGLPDGTVGVRDSKDPGPVLAFTKAEWLAFLAELKAAYGPSFNSSI